MENVIKFPKEKTKLINSFNDAFENQNYRKAIEFKDELLENFELLKTETIYDKLLEAYFNLYAFEEVVIIGDELIKNAYESFDLYFYMLASLVSLVDIYRANALIKKSDLLNEDTIKFYYQNHGANYSNILTLSQHLFFETTCCLLMVNYVLEVSKEVVGNIDLDREYLLFRFFDLINMVYELGYDEWVIVKLEKTLKIMFEIDI